MKLKIKTELPWCVPDFSCNPAFGRRLVILALLALPFGLQAAQTFSNTNFIAINDSTSPPTKASLYPSIINVSNLTGQIVTKVTVSLQGLSHTYPSDIDILLVGPEGQIATVMSKVGGNDNKYSVTNLTLTLDDAAGSLLPLEAPLTSGTFKPTKNHPTNSFDLPLPAPAGNSNAPAALSVFQNTSPNGSWRLYVVDDTSADLGSITNGWALALTTAPVFLQIRLADSAHAVTYWPSSLTNFILQSTHNLSPTVTWSNISSTPVIVGGQWTVTNAVSTTNTFYRLMR